MTYGLEAKAAVAVYHCVDLYAEFPGIDAELVDRSEKKLAEQGVLAIGSSAVVVEHLRHQGFRTVLYWPNVADTSEILRVVSDSVQGQRSGALFAGNLSDRKVDFDLLSRLVWAGVDIHLAGPIAEGGGDSRALVEKLVAEGATYHGVLDLAQLSKLMAQRTIGLIPYLINPYTLGVSPLKTYEYLAAGLSVISTALPGVTALLPHILVAEDSVGFVEMANSKDRLNEEDLFAERIELAKVRSWQHRGEEARELIRTTRYRIMPEAPMTAEFDPLGRNS